MLGIGLNRVETMSPPPSARSRSSRSTTNARTAGSSSATWRGVNPRATNRRNAVCTGGSVITNGGLSSSPIRASSSYVTVRPRALLNVSVSTAAARTSACRDST